MVPAPTFTPSPIDGVAQIGQVTGFGPLADDRLLQLDEIADVHRFAKLGVRPDVDERPDGYPGAQVAAADDAEILNGDAILEHRVDDAHAGVNLTGLADLRSPFEVHARMDDRIGADDHVLDRCMSWRDPRW